jgi:hypothetical protein
MLGRTSKHDVLMQTLFKGCDCNLTHILSLASVHVL